MNEYIFDEDLLLVSEDGANLLARTYPIAFPISGKTWVNNHAHVLKFEDACTQKFVEHYLNSVSLDSFVSGMAQPKLNQKALNSIPIPLPPLPEQKRIVALLDRAFADIDKARANAEKNLKNAHELFESYFQQIFNSNQHSWIEVGLGNVCDFQNGFAFKSNDTVEVSKTQLIRMGNLYKNNLDLDRKPSFYPDFFADEFSRYRLNEGDLIISLTGTAGKEDYGFTVRIPRSDRKLLLNQRIAKIANINHEIIDEEFLFRILRSNSFLAKLYASANGTRQANLSTATMKKIPIFLPSVEEQVLACRKLDHLEEKTQQLERIYQSKLYRFDELKKSLLHKAFTGQLNASATKAATDGQAA